MKKRKLDKKIILIISIVLIIILALTILINLLEKEENQTEGNLTTNVGFKSIEEILEYFGCEFIKETKSKDSKFAKDIYLKFKYNTFEENKSNQRYYENIIGYISNFTNTSFRMLDEEKNLLIEIEKKYNESRQVSFIYTINGQENYFKIKEAGLNLENIEEDKNTNIQINSNILEQVKSNNWKKANIKFGTKDSSFDKYDIYFDEGIEVKNILGKVHNIIFTSKYDDEVVNGIKVGAEFEKIIDKLGNPTFGNKNGKYIGYKNSEMYVFFLEDSISIYKNEENTEMEEFDELLTKYVKKQIDIKEFMNELTYLWDDYEEYTYNSNYIYINYPSRGIRIQMNSDTLTGIQIYKNCNLTENISNLIKEGKITSRLEQDLYMKTLVDRLDKIEGYIYISSLGSGEERRRNGRRKPNEE